jgi:hypothetical protein
MNERIEKLAEQAGFTVARGQGLKDTVPKDVFIANVCVSDEMKKFAELIVRECMNAVCDPKTTYLESMTESSAMYTARERIRKHFGG